MFFFLFFYRMGHIEDRSFYGEGRILITSRCILPLSRPSFSHKEEIEIFNTTKSAFWVYLNCSATDHPKVILEGFSSEQLIPFQTLELEIETHINRTSNEFEQPAVTHSIFENVKLEFVYFLEPDKTLIKREMLHLKVGIPAGAPIDYTIIMNVRPVLKW
jgi:hypothetical protein